MQGAIFPGISREKRKDYIEEYINTYNEEPIRTVTLIHDLVGLLSYIYENKLSIKSIPDFINDPQVSFDGIDGEFSFNNNLITRDLEILKIVDGSTISVE